MENHYFTNTNLPLSPFKITFDFKGKSFTIYSDNGVFSKDKADYGSLFLVQKILELPQTQSILDLGCGNGVVGILLGIYNKDSVIDLVDVNIRAVELAKLNIEEYRLDKLNAFVSDGFTEIDKKYQLIAFNPPIRAGKKTFYPLYQECYQHLVDNGILMIVIRKDLGAPSSVVELKKYFKSVEIYSKSKGYFVIKAVK